MKQLKKSWFISLCYFILIKPGCISGIPALSLLDSLINLIRIVLVVYIFLIFIKYMRKVPNNRLFKVLLLTLLSIIWEPITTIFNGAKVADVGALLNNIGIALITYMGLSAGYDTFIKGIARLTGAYVIINFATVLLFPNGLYASAVYTQNYFLSYRTSWFIIYLLALTTCLLWYENERSRESKKWCISVVVSAFVSICIVWTATSIFCFSLAAGFLIVWRIRSSHGMEIKKMMTIEAVLFWGIVVKRLQEYFAFIIVGLLHKDITLTARTRIWDNAFDVISNHFWNGVGRLNTEQMRNLLGFGASHPHCRYLYIMMCFGIIGLVLFLATVYISNKGPITEEKMKEGQIISVAFIALLTAGLVESFSATGGYIFPLYFLAASVHCSPAAKVRDSKYLKGGYR